MSKPNLQIYLAAPRGFCAGVDRAIKIVEMALQKWGAPVYVRHEIVHNKFVVDGLRDKGAVFVEELSDSPDDRRVSFPAHRVGKGLVVREKPELLHRKAHEVQKETVFITQRKRNKTKNTCLTVGASEYI